VLEGIQILREAPAFPHSPSRIRNLLANLVPYLTEYSGCSYRPRDLFSRFDRFCEALGTRANLYTEVIENQDFRDRLFRLLASGDFLSETLIQRPELLDAVIHRQAEGSYLQDLRSSMARHEDGDQPRVLRAFKQREEFKIALEELKAPGGEQTRQSLTRLAEACIQAVCGDYLKRSPALESAAFAILALGKLGGAELIFHSDLDLVLVYDDTGQTNTSEAMVGLLKDLRKWLQSYTDAGRAYQIDFRLRPEGRHATEAVPLTKLIGYFQDRAEPWERLAYVKARTIYSQGCSVPFQELAFHSPFSDAEIEKLRQVRFRKEHEIGKEENSEYFDLKVGKGSLLDVQFVVQSLQVKHNVMEPNLLSAISKLGNEGYLDTAKARLLREGLQLLYALESIDDLLGVKPAGKLSKRPDLNDHLAQWLCLGGGEKLTERYLDTTGDIRSIYLHYFG
jgi:glutamate-ammonia-ligase adenylyltransferase